MRKMQAGAGGIEAAEPGRIGDREREVNLQRVLPAHALRAASHQHLIWQTPVRREIFGENRSRRVKPKVASDAEATGSARRRGSWKKDWPAIA